MPKENGSGVGGVKLLEMREVGRGQALWISPLTVSV